MTSDSVWQVVRYLLIAGGSFAAAKGWVTSDQVTFVIGALGTIFTVAWDLREVRHPRDHRGHRCANRRAGHQCRDWRGQVNHTQKGFLMRKLFAAAAVISGLALAGCQTVTLPSLNLNTVVTLNTIYGIENADGIAVNTTNAYNACRCAGPARCWARPTSVRSDR